MGLDMYLYLRKYESCSAWRSVKNVNDFYPQEMEKLATNIYERNFLSKETTYQVGYWRKVNAIHNWFVEKCANGVDECQRIYVSVSQIKELLSVVDSVLQDNTKASELLPTTEGFFFGSQEYDEWYFEELKYTKRLIESVLEFLNSCDTNYDIIYAASW